MTENQERKRYQRKTIDTNQPEVEELDHVEEKVATEGSFTKRSSSPVFKAAEERFVEDVPKSLWLPITEAQQTGKNYLVAKTENENGVVAYWRRTRVMLHNRWSLQGKWTLFEDRRDLDFEPVYYQEIK